MKRILLLAIIILSLPKAKGQCKLSLRNLSDSTITIRMLRLGITHTLSPQEKYTLPWGCTIRKNEPYIVDYKGEKTASLASKDTTGYLLGCSFEISFSYSYKMRGWTSFVTTMH